MGTVTSIAWCDHTFNGWQGCTRVSPACDHCYAAAAAKRYGATDPAGLDLWDPHAERRRLKTRWALPPKWDAAAVAAGRRARVFCMSWADTFDNQVPPEWRADLWALIRATPALDWMLLTKRPQNIAKMLPADWGAGWPNVWLGTTVENMTEARRRIPYLLSIPAPVHFISAEPMLEPLDLAPWLGPGEIDWVIAGGESGVGRRSRPMQPAWLYGLREQVESAGASLFLKQLGSNRDAWPGLRHPKGEDPAEWPADLRIQEFPHCSREKRQQGENPA